MSSITQANDHNNKESLSDGNINKENEKPTIQTIDEIMDKLLSNSSRFLSWNNLDLKNIMHFPTNIETNDEYINVQIAKIQTL